MTAFPTFLQDQIELGGFSTEDVLVSFLPLMQQVILTHEYGEVAPLEGLGSLQVEQRRIWYPEASQRPQRRNLNAVQRLLQTAAGPLTILRESNSSFDVATGEATFNRQDVADDSVEITQPVWLGGYCCWEHRIGHHDPVTDVYSLGLILASLACSLNLTEAGDHDRFVNNRNNLFRVNPQLHPVLARTIVVMTELDRHKRPPDLRALHHTLENYRDQEVDFDTDLASQQLPVADNAAARRRAILEKLRERLFEINRRNRLLHFRSTMNTVNLTQASIPLSFDVKSIRDDQVLTWNGSFCDEVVSQKPVVLNKYLNFREAVYLPGTLDQIRTEARRDENDYGFAQLRLIVAFLRWADLKAQPPEQYESPLLLLPIRLDVKKGIHDRYLLQALNTQAEVNPVIRHLFRQLYSIELPESIEVTRDGVDEFVRHLCEHIRAGDASVELRRVDQPRIEIIHDKARRRLDQYRRRVKLGGKGIRNYHDLDYSYDPINYHPLGIRIYEHFVAPPQTHLESIILASQRVSQKTSRRSNLAAADNAREAANKQEKPVVEAEGHFFQLQDEVDDNPLNWEIDFCSVTLANLKYRRMSLAQDYNRLITDGIDNPAFEATFAVDSNGRENSDAPATIPLSDRFQILPCDPTQMTATLHSRLGTSYIIQGPPGTGKSQTIANLIADFVMKGKRVLFVCEKRAAVDVVYHRLKQQGLQDLCCLIHDSQADKKQFVMDLKRTYDDFLAESGKPRNKLMKRRGKTVRAMEAALRPLAEFNQTMISMPASCGISVRSLIDRLLNLRHLVPELAPTEWERVPPFSDFDADRRQLDDFRKRLIRIQSDGVLARHPIRLLSADVVDAERPVNLIAELLEVVCRWLYEIQTVLSGTDLPPESTANIRVLRAAVEYATSAGFLADRDLVQLLDADSEMTKSLLLRLRKLQKCDALIKKAEQKNTHWKRKLSSEDTRNALKVAKTVDGKWFSFMRPPWWRLRRTLNSAYDFSAHAVAPGWTQILNQLDFEHERKADRYDVAQQISDEFDIHLDLDQFLAEWRALQERLESESAAILHLNQFVISSDDGNRTLRTLIKLKRPLDEFDRTAAQFLDAYEFFSLPELAAVCRQLSEQSDQFPEYLHCLEALRPVARSVASSLRTLPLTIEQLEAASAAGSLRTEFRDHPDTARFCGEARSDAVVELAAGTDLLFSDNAAAVRESVRQRFCDNVVVSETSATQLTNEQKELKTQYSRGRRELEHEFGKSMRYKSIRELAEGDTGAVIRDLKPVWLMSPLSVSDTLPLNAENFDAVIFDEASQITLEDAVPALFRAGQAIVVGDEMQLPPTSFFSSRRSDDDELEFEEEGDVVHYDLNSSSLLNHATKNISSTLLGWHYRSRSESLISFSNHAFYAGRLLTVPEEQLPSSELPELEIDNAEQADALAAELTNRPVSFHFMKSGVYEKRRNRVEADYIARLVRSLLLNPDVSHSIGIVAFSEAQQSEIDRSLQVLADSDADFAEVLEAELEREDDGQFAGLLVRNLENIQGDERDIIIMSVCYGPDPDGKVRMNFGPINMAGGEKRLNVAFSRAKKFMALVTSLRSTAITNDYNDGANCLKKYLRYAEACSAGNSDVVSSILRSLSGRDERAAEDEVVSDPLLREIAERLQQSGFQVDFNVGQSHFRVDLAIRCEGDSEYRLGILTDSVGWYRQTDLVERELLKPRLLSAFGWRIHVVLAKDWFENREACIQELLQLVERA